MRTASDTPDERLAEYGELFARAMVRRERPEHAVVFAFRATPGTREHVEDLARREAACCPFVDHRVQTTGEEVVYTVTNPSTGMERADAEVTLDAFYALPDAGPLDRLAERGVGLGSVV
jgi:hypothetical protein